MFDQNKNKTKHSNFPLSHFVQLRGHLLLPIYAENIPGSHIVPIKGQLKKLNRRCTIMLKSHEKQDKMKLEMLLRSFEMKLWHSLGILW